MCSEKKKTYSLKKEGKVTADKSPKRQMPKKTEPKPDANRSIEMSPQLIMPKSDKKFKIPPAPVLRKKLSDEAKALSEMDHPEQFSIYARRMVGCFGNLDLVPEPDIDDALQSLQILMASKNKGRLYVSPLFNVLTKLAVDFKKDIHNKLRRALVFLL